MVCFFGHPIRLRNVDLNKDIDGENLSLRDVVPQTHGKDNLEAKDAKRGCFEENECRKVSAKYNQITNSEVFGPHLTTRFDNEKHS